MYATIKTDAKGPVDEEQNCYFGGTGVIGGHLARALSPHHPLSITGSKLPFDSNFGKDTSTAFYFTHLGASGGAIVSEQALQQMIQENSDALQKAFESVPKARQFVLVSSGGTVYGEAGREPIRENHSCHPISGYGKVKLHLENFAKELSSKNGVPFTIVRPSNVYGPHQKNNLVGAAIHNLRSNVPVQIYGPTGVTRDYLYIDCLIDALKILVEEEGRGETFNLGTGVGTNTVSVVRAIAQILGHDPKKVMFEELPARKSDVEFNVLDSTLFQQKFGWKSKVDLLEGLKLTLGN